MRTFAAILFVLVAVCTDVPRTQAADQDLVITVRLQGAQVDMTRTFVHRADDNHRCMMPARKLMPTADKPKPSPEEPPNYVYGYSVEFGPDRSTVEAGGSPMTLGGGPGPPIPGADLIVDFFTLMIEPLPDQLLTSGPVRLSRSFRVELSARMPWKGQFTEGDRKWPGSVTLDRDGRGGRFRLTNLEVSLTHNRVPESEYVTVTGSWRCPAP
jgi:hypothetical protein